MDSMDEKDGIQFELPFKPYPNQLIFMKDAYECFEHSRFGLFESPTGSGKTVSILCSTLTWYDNIGSESHKIYRLKNNRINSLMCNLNLETSNDENVPKWVKQCAHDQKRQMAKDIIREGAINLENLREKILEKIDNSDGVLKIRRNYKRMSSNTPESDFKQEFGDPIKTQIIICSRTFSQLNQYVKEFRKLKGLNENIRLSMGSGRTHVCINNGVKSRCKNSDELNEECRRTKCEYRSDTSDLSEISTCYPLDLEDLVRLGKELNSCPYYSNLSTVPDADIVLAPYVTIINESLRESLGIRIKDNILIFDEGHNLIDAITESHSSKVTLVGLKELLLQLKGYSNKYKSEIRGVVLERITEITNLVTTLINGLAKGKSSENMKITSFNVMYSLEDFKFHEIINFLSSTQFCKHLRGYAERQYHIKLKLLENGANIKNDAPLNAITTNIRSSNSNLFTNKYVCKDVKGITNNVNSKNDLNGTVNNNRLTDDDSGDKAISYTSMIYTFKNFIYSLLYCDSNDRIIVNKQESDTVIEVFPVASVSDSKSVIVMSGTLSPIEEFLSLVPNKTEPYVHKSPPVFTIDRFLTTIVDRDSEGNELVFDYSRRENQRELKFLCNLVESLADVVPNGIVCFFSSYSYLNVFYNNFIKSDSYNKVSPKKDIFKEQKNVNVFPEYSKKCIDKGAILFAVFGGNQSEGVDFSDELARLVLLVGVPYPPDSIKLKLKREYYNKKALECTNGPNSSNYMKLSTEQRTLLCYKTINQCIGRAMRHKEDYAAVVLLDSRYRNSEAKQYLSNYAKKSINEHECTNKHLIEMLNEFYNKLSGI